MAQPSQRNPRTFALIVLGCLAVSLVCVAYPLYVIRPFRYQGAGELAVALAITQLRPAITVMGAMAAVLALIGYWRVQPRKWWRILPSAGALLTIALVFLARVNVYEIMFHPNQHPSFVAAADTKLDGAEKVIAVRMGNTARAYPIRSMSYHHIANDVLDGVAIVATY